MTKEEAIMALQHKEAYDVRIDYKFAEALITQIFDEKETCEGCSYEADRGQNFPIECSECRRWYADGYTTKESK